MSYFSTIGQILSVPYQCETGNILEVFAEMGERYGISSIYPDSLCPGGVRDLYFVNFG